LKFINTEETPKITAHILSFDQLCMILLNLNSKDKQYYGRHSERVKFYKLRKLIYALHCAKKSRVLSYGYLKFPGIGDLRLSRICISRKKKEKEEERTPGLITPVKISGTRFRFMNRKSTN